MRKILLTTNLMLLLCLMATAVRAQTIIYVNDNAGGTPDGTSWTNAFTSLQAAINAATGPTDQIWVAAGNYIPTEATTADPRSKTFIVNKALNVFGGFAGNEPPAFDLNTRNIAANVTTLSGALGAEGAAYHVLSAVDATGTVVLDGFTVTGGNANGTANIDKDGAGLYVRSSTVTLNNNVFANNLASGYGGAISSNAVTAAAALTITKCSFTNNEALHGGAIDLAGSANPAPHKSSVTITESSFVLNRALSNNTGLGGGALRGGSKAEFTVTTTLFKENKSIIPPIPPAAVSAGGVGGAIYINDPSREGFTNISRCRFISNTAWNHGGAIYFNNAGSISIHNSLFHGNVSESTSTIGGGALALQNAFNLTISGTTFSKNVVKGTRSGGAIRTATTAGVVFKIYNSIFSKNTQGTGTTSSDIVGVPDGPTSAFMNNITQGYNPAYPAGRNDNNQNIDPLFINEGNDPDHVDFLRLEVTSPARQYGDVALASGTLDLAGNLRTQGGVDLGAYQTQATLLPVELESFDVKKVANGAQLTWKVLSETNNEKFVVERSGDGQNFTVIASIVSRGNTNQAAIYSHLDNAPLNGKNYYRLSQTDKDGTSKVLGIRVLDFEISVSAIQVYPNPATDVVKVKVSAVQSHGAKVSLYSLAGAELMSQQINKSEAEQGFDLDVRNFNSGAYVLVVDKGNVTEKTKVVIVR